MQALPHHYKVKAQSAQGNSVMLSSHGVPDLETDAPAEFGGRGDLWSPETMLAGAIANCLILSFRAIARASKLDWNDLACDVEAVLERVDRVTRFTKINMRVELSVPAGVDQGLAERLLDKSKSICLITNSMTAEISMDKTITFS